MFQKVLNRMGVAGRLCQFLWRERLWWLIPMVVVVLACGAVVLLTHSAAVAPFIYTLF